MKVPNITLTTDRRLTKEGAEWMALNEKLLNDFCDSPEFEALMTKGMRDLMVYGTSTLMSGEIEGAFKAFHIPHKETLKDEKA